MKKKYVTRLISATPGLEESVLSLDRSVKQALSSSSSTVRKIKEEMENIEKLRLESIDPDNKIWKVAKENIDQKLNKITNNNVLVMYLSESAEVVEAYKNVLKKPVKMSFMGPVIENSSEKNKLHKKYMEIYAKYASFSSDLKKPLDVNTAEEEENENSNELVCETPDCKSTEFKQLNETMVCEKCSRVHTSPMSTTSYSDIDRINVSTRYLYDRKVHFRDCVLQFQGRQNVTIDKSVYESLESEFDKHHLLIGDKNTPGHIRFSKINKEHILMFLKELRLSKHYENVQLIHFNLTGKPPPDISHLEGALLADFEQLTTLYDEIYRYDSRKNFINTQYTLFQLLKRHKYPCNASDFSIIKTSERRDWHHRVCKTLFSKLNWNFTSV
jgi:hypothetical protein